MDTTKLTVQYYEYIPMEKYKHGQDIQYHSSMIILLCFVRIVF
jgi:hypothetical protein